MFKKIVITSLCIILIVAFTVVNISYANDNFNTNAFEGHDSGTAGSSMSNFAGGVLSVVRIACVGIGLIMLTVLGMKYMLASPNDRAEIKGSAIRYVLGAIIMFAASGLLTIIQGFAASTIPEGS